MSASIALTCAVVLTLQIRDRWHAPEITSPEAANLAMTGKVARDAGAQVLPTDRSLTVEPKPAAPKQAQPANPNLTN